MVETWEASQYLKTTKPRRLAQERRNRVNHYVHKAEINGGNGVNGHAERCGGRDRGRGDKDLGDFGGLNGGPDDDHHRAMHGQVVLYSPQSPKALRKNDVHVVDDFGAAHPSKYHRKDIHRDEVRRKQENERSSPVGIIHSSVGDSHGRNGRNIANGRNLVTGRNMANVSNGGRKRSAVELLKKMFSKTHSTSSSRGVRRIKDREDGAIMGNGQMVSSNRRKEEPWISPVSHQGIENVTGRHNYTAGHGKIGNDALVDMQGKRKRDFLRSVFACLNPKRGITYDPWAEYAMRIPTLQPDYTPKTPLLDPQTPDLREKITLVLDLDETLVHSSFVPMPDADFTIPLEMEGQTHTVYVRKRPLVDKFLRTVTQWYEVIVFTASLSLYANPVMDMLDPEGLVHYRLYREHCVLYGECYVKDIGILGRDIKRTIIVDNSPLSYVLQPENAFPINGFTDDMNDRELDKILSLLEKARTLSDVRDAYS